MVDEEIKYSQLLDTPILGFSLKLHKPISLTLKQIPLTKHEQLDTKIAIRILK